jgi:hypothetical protein
MSARTSAAGLVAVDGVNGAAVLDAARAEIGRVPRGKRGGISQWDASGVFDDLTIADATAGRASARTLLLLYAADLSFRLRWEITPTLAEGRTVVAAPYVDTAIAFGLAAGLPKAWLANLFQFAPRPAARVVDKLAARPGKSGKGFVEFGSRQIVLPRGSSAANLQRRARTRLAAIRRR